MVISNTNRIFKCRVFSRANHLYRPFKTGVMTFYQFAVTLAKQKLLDGCHCLHVLNILFARNTALRNTRRIVVIFIPNFASKCRVLSRFDRHCRPFKTGVITFYKFAVALAKQKRLLALIGVLILKL